MPSSFIHLHVLPKLYDLIFSVEHKTKFFLSRWKKLYMFEPTWGWVNIDRIVIFGWTPFKFNMNSLLLAISTACWVMSSAVSSRSSGSGSCSFRLRESSAEEIQSSNRCTSSLSASRADSMVWILSACCFAHIWTWCMKSHMNISHTCTSTQSEIYNTTVAAQRHSKISKPAYIS